MYQRVCLGVIVEGQGEVEKVPNLEKRYCSIE